MIFRAEKNTGNLLKKEPYTEKRILPERLSPPITITTFGNFTTFFLWGEKPLAIQIESEKISKGFKDYFNLLWKISKEI